MTRSKAARIALAVTLLVTAGFVVARSRHPASGVIREGEKVLQRASPPPRADEVQSKIQAIFGSAVTLAADLTPSFVAGDFNGDGLPDLAVFVKPTSSGVEAVNSDVANWILEDPLDFPRIRPEERVMREPSPRDRARAEPGRLLLAIVHGYGPDGWRSSQARQAFLLIKTEVGEIHPQPFDETLLPKGHRLLLSTPRIDIIRGTLAGHPGFLYWSGAKYVWATLGPEGTLIASSPDKGPRAPLADSLAR